MLVCVLIPRLLLVLLLLVFSSHHNVQDRKKPQDPETPDPQWPLTGLIGFRAGCTNRFGGW